MTVNDAEQHIRSESGPFDVIGDIHGCYFELRILLAKLGWTDLDRYESLIVEHADAGQIASDAPTHPRQAVFVGDLTDRGPYSVGVLRLVMGMVAAGDAICLKGNHDDKLARKLEGRKVQVSHGLETTLSELEQEPMWFVDRVSAFLQGLVSYCVLDGGQLVVAHAGIKEDMIGEYNGKVRSFTMYRDTTGQLDEFGLPERRDWAASYAGTATVVYGHMPVREAVWVNNTIDIDTGCVFGGMLTALRYPERELVSVPAQQVYYEREGFI